MCIGFLTDCRSKYQLHAWTALTDSSSQSRCSWVTWDRNQFFKFLLDEILVSEFSSMELCRYCHIVHLIGCFKDLRKVIHKSLNKTNREATQNPAFSRIQINRCYVCTYKEVSWCVECDVCVKFVYTCQLLQAENKIKTSPPLTTNSCCLKTWYISLNKRVWFNLNEWFWTCFMVMFLGRTFNSETYIKKRVPLPLWRV